MNGGSPGLPRSGWRPSSRPDVSPMDPITLPEDFREFLRLLDARAVEYLLIGGYAVGYHGYPEVRSAIGFLRLLTPPA